MTVGDGVVGRLMELKYGCRTIDGRRDIVSGFKVPFEIRGGNAQIGDNNSQFGDIDDRFNEVKCIDG